MLRIGKLTDYATRLMACMAAQPETVNSAVSLAERARLEVPTVSKLLKLLTQAGLVESFRGVSGGYRLANSPESISIADIVSAIEGPIAMTECSLARESCHHEPHCEISGTWQQISKAIETTLKKITLADMAQAQKSTRRKPLPTHIAIIEATNP